MSSEEASLPRKITAMLNSRFSVKQGLNPPSNVLNTRLQHLQAVISVICIIILPSAIPLLISLVFLLEKQLLVQKLNKKYVWPFPITLSPMSLPQQISINIFHYFSKEILEKNYWHVACSIPYWQQHLWHMKEERDCLRIDS